MATTESDPNTRARSLLPAPDSGRSSRVATPALRRSYPMPSRKRAGVTVIACGSCRKRKTKCDGIRPVCGNCVRRQPCDCVYEHDGHQTRTAALKHKVIELQKEVHRLKEALDPSDEQNNQADSSTSEASPTSLFKANRRTSSTSIEIETPREARLNGAITDLRDDRERLKELLSMALGQHELTGSQLTQLPYGCTPSWNSASLPGNLTHQDDWIPTPFAYPSPVGTVMSTMAHSGPAALDNISDPASFSLESPNLRDRTLGTPTYPAHGEQQFSQISTDWNRYDAMRDIFSSPPYTGYSGNNTPLDSRGYEPWTSAQMQGHACFQGIQRPNTQDDIPPRFPSPEVIQRPLENSLMLDSNPALSTLPIRIVRPCASSVDPDAQAMMSMPWEFYCSSQRRLAQGVPLEKILGSPTPDLQPFLTKQLTSSLTSVSMWASLFTLSIVDEKLPLHDKITCAYANMLLMRWHIWPSNEAYSAIPCWLRPSRIDLGAVNTLAPTQSMLGTEMNDLPAGDIFTHAVSEHVSAFAAFIALDWPFVEDGVFCRDGRTGSLQINPLFEVYLLDVKNWILDMACVEQLPSLAETAKFRRLQSR